MVRDIDEEVVRNRRDPRREESLPPTRKPSSAPPEGEAVDVLDLAPKPTEPPKPEPEPVAAAKPEPKTEERPSTRKLVTRDDEEPPSRRARVTNVDPRLEAIDPLVRAGDWNAVLASLGPADRAGNLPPNLGLVYALALKEKETADDKKASDNTALAIRCVAGLLGAAPQSDVALVIAKRLIRKNPVSFRERPAPAARWTILIIVIAIAIGSAIGWAVASGHVRVQFRF